MYRLDVFSVRLLPLREHLCDLATIAEGLLEELCQRYGRRTLVLQQPDLDALRRYSFPGNVRELRNILERSLLRSNPDTRYLMVDMPWLNGRQRSMPTTLSRTSVPTDTPVQRELSPLEEQEYQLIAETLTSQQGGIRRTAAKLGLTPQALLRRLQKWPELRQRIPTSEAGRDPVSTVPDTH